MGRYEPKAGDPTLKIPSPTPGYAGRLPLDVAAAFTADRKTLTVGVVNPTGAAVELNLAVAGIALAGPATRWHITGPDHFAHNSPGKPRVVDIKRTESRAPVLNVPALSCSVFELPVR